MIDSSIVLHTETLASAKVLRENLASSSKFGFSVLGVTVTSRLLAKAAATIASMALPPSASSANPALTASGLPAATAPWRGWPSAQEAMDMADLRGAWT